VIDADGSSPAVTLRNNGPDMRFTGFHVTHASGGSSGTIYMTGSSATVTGTWVDDCETNSGGGAFYVYGTGATPHLSDLLLVNNRAESGGGGIWIYQADLTLEDSTLYLNDAGGGSGGGIAMGMQASLVGTNLQVMHNTAWYCGGGIHSNGTAGLELYSSTITDNTVHYEYGEGGGICAYNDTPILLSDVTVARNSAPDNGGGLHLSAQVDVTIDGATIADNTTQSYGGGIDLWSSYLAMSNSVVTGNEAVNGGGLYVHDNWTATIEGCEISHNVATGSGGGLHIIDPTLPFTLTMSDLRIAHNHAGAVGGGIYSWGNDYELSHSVVAGNSTDNGNGAGLYIAYSEPTLSHLRVLGNEIIDGNSRMGAGIYIDSGYPDEPVITQSAVVGNVITGDSLNKTGAGIAIVNYAQPRIEGCTIAYNSMEGTGTYGGYYDENGYATLHYTNSWGNEDIQFEPDLEGQYGNISEDPGHPDVGAADPLDWDVHLGAGSLCVDAGDFSLVDPDGSRADMGAYGGEDAEFWDLDGDGYPEWWQPGDYDDVLYPGDGWDCDDLDDDVYPGNGC